MALRKWTGATNGNFSFGTNWDPVGVPANGDDLVVQGSVAINGSGGLPLANVPSSISVTPNYAATIGAAGNPLEMSCTTLNYNSGGRGAYFTGDYPIVNVSSRMSGAPGLVLDEKTAAGIDQLYISSGLVTTTAGMSITHIHVGGYSAYLNNNATGPFVYLSKGFAKSSVRADLFMVNGHAVWDGTFSPAIQLIMLGGVLDYKSESELSNVSDVVGGVLNLNAVALPSTNRPLYIFEQGTVNVTGTFKVGSPVLVRNLRGRFLRGGEALEVDEYAYPT
jgi:hypothetical protein